MQEQTLSSKLIYLENGYEIYRVEARMYDEYKDKYIGHTKVYYDVCFLSYNTVRNYIAGYYGIDPSAIENFTVNKKENKVTFSIADKPQTIDKL